MPARKPRALKLLTGTFRKDREPRKPARPRRGRAQPPAFLSADQRRAFRQLAAETEAIGTPTRSFTHALTGGAVVWTTFAQCNRAIAEHGETYATTTTTGAPKLLPRPEVALRNTALRLLRLYLSELGLSPVAIGRVDRAALPATIERDADEWARFQRFFPAPKPRRA